ncbi:response regulator [Rapidithrix thailandica]|uniref:Response regulator n=1 Tax=Rapidithrix thailandica TaxID=413964 RepID=A0AAW9S5M5_9BACT
MEAKKKILLIEDNPEMRENTAEILELSNFEVITAENGKVGVESAKKVKPDLIICDIMMPELDGFGVLFILSKEPETASIPFIFLTAKAEKTDFRKGMNLGADDYLTKPFDDVELLDAIESRLRKSDILKNTYSKSKEGFDSFLQDAQSQTGMEELAKDRKQRHYKKRDIIFYEGDYANAMYFVNQGKVKTYKTNDDGKEYITGIHNEGDFMGYIALLENSEHPESAMAMEDCELSIIPKSDFFTLLESNRDIANKFIKMLSNEVMANEQKLLKLAYSSVRQRVAEALLYISSRENPDNKPDFKMYITRDDLAKIVGTAKETLIRTLSDFKDEKLIEISGRGITIINQEKLERLNI